MAKLSDLPTELLLQIYCNLINIDDVLHLTRTCKTTYEVIQNRTFFEKIMRSIVVSSPIHRFDIILSDLLYLHQRLVQYFASGGARITIPQASVGNRWEQDLVECVAGRTEHVTTSQIDDIVVRWQGLKVLQNLFLEKQFKGKDYLYPSHQDFQALLEGLDILQDRGHSKDRNREVTESFDAEQSARFYTATVAYWAMNEIRWSLSQLNYSVQPVTVQRACLDALESLTDDPLLFRLDVLSVYEFLYNHLLPLHLHAFVNPSDPQCVQAILSRVPGNSAAEDERNATIIRNLLQTGQVYLQPSDLIELAVKDRVMRQTPYPTLGSLWGKGHYRLPRRLALRTITRSSFHAPQTALSTNSDWSSDPHHGWLKHKILSMWWNHARPTTTTLESVFDKKWQEECRQGVWWWACGSEKARCKMERWREEGQTSSPVNELP